MLITLPLDFTFSYVDTCVYTDPEALNTNSFIFHAKGFDIASYDDESKITDAILYQLNAQISRELKIQDFFMGVNTLNSGSLQFSAETKCLDQYIQGRVKDMYRA